MYTLCLDILFSTELVLQNVHALKKLRKVYIFNLMILYHKTPFSKEPV